jgi:uncharacterized protein
VRSILAREEPAVGRGIALVESYGDDGLFRKRVVMDRHGYGQGEYKYFTYPLPERVAALRAAFYPPLAAIANRWNAALGDDNRYPEAHAAFLERPNRFNDELRRFVGRRLRRASRREAGSA